MVDYEITELEIQQIREMNEWDMANLAMFVHTLEATPILLEENVDQDKSNPYWECLTLTTGLSLISGLGDYIGTTVGLISAKTVLKIVIKLGARSLGWISLMATIYEFVECVNEKKQGTEQSVNKAKNGQEIKFGNVHVYLVPSQQISNNLKLSIQ